MEQWHLSDRVIPTESAFRNAKWRGFPPEELFRWSNASSSESESDYPGRLGKPVILDARDKASAKVWGILIPYPEAEWVFSPESIMPQRPIERSSKAEG